MLESSPIRATSHHPIRCLKTLRVTGAIAPRSDGTVRLPPAVSAVVRLCFVCLAAFLIATFVCGCATSPGRRQPVGESIQVPVTFWDSAQKPVPLDERPQDLSLQLAAIPGAVAGTPGPTLYNVPIGRLPSIRLDLAFLAANVRQHVSQLSAHVPAQVTLQLQILPEETQFARVSTLVWFTASSTVTESIGFVEAGGTDALILTYFDRPCRLTGTILVRNGSRGLVGQDKSDRGLLTIEYDVKIDSPGFAWLVSREDGPSHAMVFRSPAPHPVLAVRPRTP